MDANVQSLALLGFCIRGLSFARAGC